MFNKASLQHDATQPTNPETFGTGYAASPYALLFAKDFRQISRYVQQALALSEKLVCCHYNIKHSVRCFNLTQSLPAKFGPARLNHKSKSPQV